MADDAFAMSSYLIKPYAQNHLTKEKRIFNYGLSRAWRVVENAFEILANCFRVFMTPIALCPEKVEVITLTCCIFCTTIFGTNHMFTHQQKVQTMKTL